jgi:hypothetical protein
VSAGTHLNDALAAEREAFEALLAGRPAEAALDRSRLAYLASHAESGPRSWGRLVGALKMAILAGHEVEPTARLAIEETEGVELTPAIAYARVLAQVALRQPPDVSPMLGAGEAFERTGRALQALAGGDQAAYRTALLEIVADFESRDSHLSGVPIADTALVLERLAGERGMAVQPPTPLLPQALTPE